MRMNGWWYLRLLEQCQSEEAEQRLKAWHELGKDEYPELVNPQFLLDRLNWTGSAQEQSAILELMCLIKQPLPVDALMAILEDGETSGVFVRMGVAHTLAVVKAEEALDLFLRITADPQEQPCLREMMTADLSLWGTSVSHEAVLSLLTDPDLAVYTAALEVVREWPADDIPLELILPYCTHEEAYVREAAIKTLLAAGIRIPVEILISALRDPEPQVRTAASFGCIRLLEGSPDLIPLKPLLQVLDDDYPPVRENILDALGKIPLRIPIEPIAAALADSTYYVRCAALETLSLMGERVPSSLYPLLQELSGSDPVPQVRLRATRALLVLHGIDPGPLKMPVVDFTGE